MKNFLNKIGQYSSIGLGLIALDGYRRTLLDERINQQIDKAMKTLKEINVKSEELLNKENQISNSLIDTNNKLAGISNDLGTIGDRLKHKAELLNHKVETFKKNVEELSLENKQNLSEEIDKLSGELFESSENYMTVVQESSKILTELSNSINNKYTIDFENIWEKVNNILSNASAAELGAIGHICLSIGILFCLLSLVSVFYGDTLIIRFKLEDRFPRLARFIQLRRKFQQYYFFYNVIIIVFILLYIIYINLCVLIYSM